MKLRPCSQAGLPGLLPSRAHLQMEKEGMWNQRIGGLGFVFLDLGESRDGDFQETQERAPGCEWSLG